MDDKFIKEQIEELIARFGIQIRYEPMHQDEESIRLVGGLCRLRGEDVLIINSKATANDKIKALAEALKHFDLDRIYILPTVRDFLKKIPE